MNKRKLLIIALGFFAYTLILFSAIITDIIYFQVLNITINTITIVFCSMQYIIEGLEDE